MICRHQWSVWRTSERGDLHGENGVIGRWMRQEKECRKCGKVKLRLEKARV